MSNQKPLRASQERLRAALKQLGRLGDLDGLVADAKANTQRGISRDDLRAALTDREYQNVDAVMAVVCGEASVESLTPPQPEEPARPETSNAGGNTEGTSDAGNGTGAEAQDANREAGAGTGRPESEGETLENRDEEAPGPGVTDEARESQDADRQAGAGTDPTRVVEEPPEERVEA